MHSIRWLGPVVLCALAQTSGPPAVVAVVNGRNITRRELERRVAQSRSMDPAGFDRMGEAAKKRAQSRVLHARIVQELEYQEAVKQGIRVSDEEVSLALDRVRRSFPTQEAFRKSLSEGRITVAEWSEEMRKTLMIAKLEHTVSAGLTASQWLQRRPDWIEGLRSKARIRIVQ